MTGPIRCTVVGASGRMGLAILEELEAVPEMEAVHVFTGPDDDRARALGPRKLLPASDLRTALRESDVAIDFSSVEGTMALLDAAVAEKCAVVTGTTGLSPEQEAAWLKAAEQIAICRAANFSIGIQVLEHLVELATRACGPTFDVEIFEAHHNRKLDAPSGTALALGRSAAAGMGVDFESSIISDRHGISGARQAGRIGFQALRGGDIVGEHTVFLCALGERLELTHRAMDRAIFARGAIRAAAWLHGKDAQNYTLSEVLFGATETSA
jgi:4-hydroxy-tetrahydrodipicolinate reductase